MLTEIPLLKATHARGDVDSFIHTRAATYGWAGCALHKRSGRETGSPSQSTLGGRHPSVGRGTPSKHTQGCHLPAKSQMLGSCTGPRGGLGLICPTWASSVQARSLCCAKPLAGLHHRISPSADRVPWSPPTSHTGAVPGKFQLLVIDSSREWGRRSGGIHPLRSSNTYTHTDTHTHTHTHTAPLSAGGQSLPPLCPTSCPAAPIPADTGPDARIQRTSLPRPHRTLHRCTTELVCVATRNTGHPRGGPDTAHRDTQDHPGSTPKPPPNTRAVQLPVDTQPCVSGHSRP